MTFNKLGVTKCSEYFVIFVGTDDLTLDISKNNKKAHDLCYLRPTAQTFVTALFQPCYIYKAFTPKSD